MRSLFALLLFVLSVSASAAPRADKLSWSYGGTDFDGYMVWDDASKAPRPGLLMIPPWYGINDSEIADAKTIAGKDYVILLVDMYGRGVRPANPDEAGKAAGAVYADPAMLRGRIDTALATLRGVGRKAPVDQKRIGAFGFCFGGAVSLELARSGADIAGVASFHGNLKTKLPAAKGAVKARVLAMNGADDTFVKAEDIANFQSEMRDAGADWQFVNFGGAVHCFAVPEEHGALPGCEFNAAAYRRSMLMMRNFFAEAFAP
jgi:dienelactone hydrolase